MSEGAMPSKLQRPVDPGRDHVRGGAAKNAVVVVLYGDYLCPYCRRLRVVMARLRRSLGGRMAYVFRHYPNEKAHPGAEFAARAAEAAAAQGLFWEMHDALYEVDPPLDEKAVRELAKSIGLDMARFERDVESDEVRAHVADDLAEGKHNG